MPALLTPSGLDSRHCCGSAWTSCWIHQVLIGFVESSQRFADACRARCCVAFWLPLVLASAIASRTMRRTSSFRKKLFTSRPWQEPAKTHFGLSLRSSSVCSSCAGTMTRTLHASEGSVWRRKQSRRRTWRSSSKRVRRSCLDSGRTPRPSGSCTGLDGTHLRMGSWL